MNDRQEFSEFLKDCALWGGIALALISIYFSYDGLDQTIQGGNPAYGWFTILIGIVMAVVITLLQFIFNSDFNRLSTTLKVIGFSSYIYSVYTNQLGISHLFGFGEFASWCIAIAFDVVPEAMIAWAWDDEVNGDLLGNIGKGFASLRRGSRSLRKSKQYQASVHQPKPSSTPQHSPNHGHGRERLQTLQKQYGAGKQKEKEKVDRFGGMFGE